MLPTLTHNELRVNRRWVELPHLSTGFQPEGRPFRLVHISDLHFYEYTDPRYYQRVAEQIDALAPDAIAITGDLIHYGSAHVWRAGEFLAGLRAPLGKFAAIGNHDYADGAKSRNIQAMLEESGVQVMRNRNLCLKRGRPGDSECRLWIAGLDDYKHGRPDLSKALAGLPEPGRDPVIMLAHNPLHFDAVARDPLTPVDLVLSGHTHAGHVYIPLLEPVYRHILRMKYRYGFYRRNRTRLYVTSGVGSAAYYVNLGVCKFSFPPYRYNTYPEIAVLELVSSLSSEVRDEIQGDSESVSAFPVPENAR